MQMNAKSKSTQEEFIDPDDAPEITEELLKLATYRIGVRVVSKEEFRAAMDAQIREARLKRRANRR